jgi:hypothetical protein
LEENEHTRIEIPQCGCAHFSDASRHVEKKVWGRQKLAVPFRLFIRDAFKIFFTSTPSSNSFAAEQFNQRISL